MKYVIGIDGGGTKTHLLAAGEQMRTLFESFGGSSNLTCLSKEAVQHNLTDLLGRFFSDSGLPPGDCVSLCLGSAGAGRETARRDLEQMLRAALPAPSCAIRVTDDAESALTGGADNGCGVLLIAGTGSICYGKNSRGTACRVGGWGHVMGDEGSGYDMASRILRAVARAWDGRDAPTALTQLVLDHWRLTGIDGLMDAVYRSGKGKSEIASLAFLCDIAYHKKDITAIRIVEECAASLAEFAAAADARLHLPGEELPCVYAGSLLEKSQPLRNHLKNKLREKCPGMELRPCAHDAAWGCARLAWRQADGT